MKVCHMTSAHMPEDTRIFHKECISLADMGYDVYLIEQGNTYEKNGVHIIGIGNIGKSRYERFTKATKLVYNAAIMVDADLYHFHDPELMWCAMQLKKRGKKVIFDSHEDTAHSITGKRWIPKMLRPFVYKVYSFYQGMVCRHIDAIVTVTPHLVDFFKRYNNEVVQIANYPDYTETYIQPNFEKKQVICAGGISKQWNHNVIMEAVNRIEGCKYLLCGWGSDEYLEELKSNHCWKSVNFRGKIPYTQVAEELSNAFAGMALLEPSANTNGMQGSMGNTKIFEEMMAGLPIICTDFVLWKEFIDKYNCGFCVKPKSVEDICTAIKYLLDNPERAKEMGLNGRKAIKEEFNWQNEKKKLFALYERI